MDKKAQSQIITTILIILLVLAAIVIVWQVVNASVRGGAEQIETRSNCLGISLEITSVNATAGTVTVKRNAGGPSGDIDVTVLINGAIQTTTKITGLAPVESGIEIYAGAIVSGDEISVAPVVEGVQCDIVDTTTA